MLIYNTLLSPKKGYIEIEINGQRTYKNIKTGVLIDHESTSLLSSRELRDQAYNSQKIILWDNKLLTVTEAATQWSYYAAENSEKASQLTELIIEAKTKIREMYPD